MSVEFKDKFSLFCRSWKSNYMVKNCTVLEFIKTILIKTKKGDMKAAARICSAERFFSKGSWNSDGNPFELYDWQFHHRYLESPKYVLLYRVIVFQMTNRWQLQHDNKWFSYFYKQKNKMVFSMLNRVSNMLLYC